MSVTTLLRLTLCMYMYSCISAWAINVKYEQPASLNCSDPSVDDITKRDVHWLNPNGVILPENFTYNYFTFAGPGEITVSRDHLNISKVLAEHFGVYFCVVINNEDNSAVAVKRGLNVNGPYFGDLWVKYQSNTLAGCLSVGIFLLIAVILVVIYVFRPNGPRSIIKKVEVHVHTHDTPAASPPGYIATMTPEPATNKVNLVTSDPTTSKVNVVTIDATEDTKF